MTLQNKTRERLEVAWQKIILDRGDGTTALRPDADLGWLEPGASVTARLMPFALPLHGTAAEAYKGRVLQLRVPVTVRQDAKVYVFHLSTEIKPL